ncbi:MAG: phosphate ABC transporter ATP-binding protein PstB [Thermoanaerobaculia bacterium]
MEEEIKILNVSAYYDNKKVLENITFPIYKNFITAIIGPSGCGKSTLIRCLNRMNDLVPNFSLEGEIVFRGKNIYDKTQDVIDLRRRVGMVFQKPNPFPKSIYENISYGLKINNVRKSEIEPTIIESLKKAALWDEVKDDLYKPATNLSGGQQQRLCIARAVALKPEVLLFDEPCSALDPIGSAKVEELMVELKKEYTVVIVTHNMQQAARVSDFTAFLYLGKLVEYGETTQIFTNPKEKLTEEYLTGRFG